MADQGTDGDGGGSASDTICCANALRGHRLSTAQQAMLIHGMYEAERIDVICRAVSAGPMVTIGQNQLVRTYCHGRSRRSAGPSSTAQQEATVGADRSRLE